jgi:hypothetical protein
LRVGSENTTTIELETVNKEFGHSSHATTTINWPTAGISLANSLSGSFGLSVPTGNPSFGTLQLEVSLQLAATVELSVFDLSGRLVGTYLKDELIPGDYPVVLNGLPSGLYTFVLNVGDQSISKQVVFLN